VRALLLLAVAAPGWLCAQAPRIGVIEFYGLRRVPEKQLRNVLGVREGDVLPSSKGDAEKRLERISGVVSARLEAVCCTGGAVVLYVGIEERGAPHFDLRPEPDGAAALPENVTASYASFLSTLARAARAGPVTENLAQGHELSSDPAARALQRGFVDLARDNLEALRMVLRDSADGFQRTCAAYVIGYAPAKRQVVDDLQYALRDPDEGVRANAIRGLAAIAALGARSPESGIRVEPTWFIELLNSLVRSDRVRSAAALEALTEVRPLSAMTQIRERALDSLADTARWKSMEDALPAFILLGRVAGISEDAIHAAWTNGREAVIERALSLRSK